MSDPEKSPPSVASVGPNSPKVPRVYISEVTLNSDYRLELREEDILLIVGPNNVGKSVFLRDICDFARENRSGIVIKSAKFQKFGSAEELSALLYELGAVHVQGARQQVNLPGVGIELPHLLNSWSQYPESLGSHVFPLFLTELNTEGRLQAANPVGPPQTGQGPAHPIHWLFRDDEIEREFSTYFRQAFGMDLALNRLTGNVTTLHCGNCPSLEPGENLTSARYIKELQQLPTAHTQGDGIRAFLGVILHAFTGNKDVLVIDEPEAFLHPPQARLLGKMLVTESPKGRQLLLSTHSTDFLIGVLSAASLDRIRLLRLTRSNNQNSVNEIDGQTLKSVWNDPLLRYSNILDGLFHDLVIIAESDGDCRFYQAIADNLGVVLPDLMFVHCGGKHRMPMLVKALRAAGVPMRVAVDFDVLNAETPLKDIVEALGADCNSVASDWSAVKKAIDDKVPGVRADDIKKEITEVLDGVKGPQFDRDAVAKIQRSLRRSSPWSIAKETGKSYVPPGTATQTFERLTDRLRTIGIHVVDVGELESFCRSVGRHGPDWVNEVIQKDLASDPELQRARDYVHRLVG